MSGKKSRSGKKLRRWAQNIHLWIGLALCLPLVVIGITGSILVFEHEIEEMLDPPESYVLAQGNQHNAKIIIKAASKAAKSGYLPSIYSPAEAGKPASVIFSPPASRARQEVLIDPVSLKVLDFTEREEGIFRTIFKLHANVLVEGRAGRQIVGWLGIFLLVIALTGLLIWWPRKGKWRAAFSVKKGKRGIKGMRFNRDLHGASGIWLYPVLFVAAFSGVYLAFPEQTGAAIRAFFPARDLRATRSITVNPEEGKSSLGVEKVIAISKKAVPEGILAMIRFPAKPDQPYRIIFDLPERNSGPAATVWVDQWSRQVVEVQDPRYFTTGETIMAWQRPLHGGYGTDWLWWKILLFIAGFLPLLFSITGIYMWLLKRRNKRRE